MTSLPFFSKLVVPASLGRWLGLLSALGPLLLGVATPAAAAEFSDFDAGRSAFSVRFGDEVISHRVMAVSVMADSSVEVSVDPEVGDDTYEIRGPENSVRAVRSASWSFSAPSTPGLYPLTITNSASGDSVKIQVFVLTPWARERNDLNGYRLGRYEMEARRGLERYEPPTGFIEVTAENRDVQVAPHFRLEQFLCKQTDATPQYALVETRLLQRLERLLAAVNAKGHRVSTLHVMSGYRTPKYNRDIGNTTEYSRHLYGDAADVFVDADGDRWMDDLTGDGRVTRDDAQYLADLVTSAPTPGDDSFDGGLGIYGSASHRGPFVHLDLRGYRARW